MDIRVSYRVPLRTLIKNEENKTVSYIRQMYGQLGVEVFESTKRPSILENNKKTWLQNFIENTKRIIGLKTKTEADFEENDSLHDVMFKYLYNQKKGTEKDIEYMFGQNGKEHFKVFQRLGYII